MDYVFSRNRLRFFGRICFDRSFFMERKVRHTRGARPIAFVYFLVGLETGIALIGGLVFLGLRGWLNYDLRRRALDQSQHGA
jgi:hypothetical protein